MPGEISKYEGEFFQNSLQGYGVYTYPQSNGKLLFSGYWFNNFRHGDGVLVWKSGKQYEGGFSNDLMHGHGTLTIPIGGEAEGVQVVRGFWERGKLVFEE